MPDVTEDTSAEDEVTLTLFVACYNEEENIVATLDTVAAACAEAALSFEVIVIDDASSDRSVELIEQYQKDHPDLPIRLFVNEKNQGLAVNYVEAAFKGRGTWYRLICGDDVEPKETLVDVFRHIGEADLVIPYQVECPGRSAMRRAISEFFTVLVNFISGNHVRYYNGLPLTRRYYAMRWHSGSHGFGYSADLITRLLSRGVSYIEVPVKARERAAGESKAITFRNICSVFHSLLNIFIRRVSEILFGHS